MGAPWRAGCTVRGVGGRLMLPLMQVGHFLSVDVASSVVKGVLEFLLESVCFVGAV